MDPAYVSAFAGLAGATIGGLTSLTASWLTQHLQFRTQQRTSDLGRREALYRRFIEEASKWYTDAITHDQAEVANLVNLYALVSEMRMLSSPRVVETAERVVRVIIVTYLAPNKTIRDIPDLLDSDAMIDAMDPLRVFSEACREELLARGAA